jgi:hypothetical protein
MESNPAEIHPLLNRIVVMYLAYQIWLESGTSLGRIRHTFHTYILKETGCCQKQLNMITRKVGKGTKMRLWKVRVQLAPFGHSLLT